MSLDPTVSPVRPVESLEPLQLGWTDPESSEQLVVEAWGAGEFLSELLALGFVVREGSRGEISEPDAETEAERDDGTGAGDRMGETCTGASSSAGLRERSPGDTTLPRLRIARSGALRRTMAFRVRRSG